jgi:hypothetical protein
MFQLKSNIEKDDSTELLFSTSRTSSKLFKSLTIEPESNSRIYLRFIPLPSPAIQKNYQSEGNSPNTFVEEKFIEVSINCRLVKDYQKLVYVRAMCHFPEFSLSKREFLFCGKSCFPANVNGFSFCNVADYAKVQTEELITKDCFQSFSEELVVTSLRAPLSYTLVGEAIFFTIEGAMLDVTNKIEEVQGTHSIHITPNLESINKHATFLRREKYIQEYISIYNRDQPYEYTLIPLRLSLGRIRNFNVIMFLTCFDLHSTLPC